jgi:hypothetical protein
MSWKGFWTICYHILSSEGLVCMHSFVE